MARRLGFVLAVASGLIGCPQQAPDRGSPAPGAEAGTSVRAPSNPPSSPPSSPPTAAAPDEPIPDPITHPCVVTSAQFDIAFRDGDKSCKSDVDCECIPLRVGSRHACSGVTSKKTGAKLRALEKSFNEMKCQATRKCAQRTCEPRCVGGQCE